MTWLLSAFGDKLSAQSGINELMRDLGEATAGKNDLLMLGGGNPAHIPEVEKLWRERWQDISRDGDQLERLLGNYDGPQGSPVFIQALVDSLRKRYGWDIRKENVAVVNGSQSAFFYIFNMLGGRCPDNRRKRILLPLAPEYIGYADQGIEHGLFKTFAPKLELIGDHQFKYHIDFDRVHVESDIGAICVSRPTNPTGNVLTDSEVSQLEELAETHHIPLIIDNAYGAPFPDIIFNDVQPLWSDSTILVMSLSKLGLPGTRTGIVLGREEFIESLSALNAVAGLANGNTGQVIAAPLLDDGRLYEVSRSVIRPYYEQKSRQAIQWLYDSMNPGLPYRIHVSEGALFLWLWFDQLPITSEELYRRLKERNVLVIPGHYFFYGLDEEHPHMHSCLRLSYAMSEETVKRGISILAEEVGKVYAGR
jgi:valine--pyruvate aminotransferase